MAAIICKNIKFLNLRLPLNVLKLDYHRIRLHQYILYGESRYSTAPYKYAMTEDSGANRDTKNLYFKSESESKSLSVESALSNIDVAITRNGRIMMKRVIEALNMVDGKGTNTSMHGLYLLRSCKYVLSETPAKRIELVNEIWKKCKELGVLFDVRHYNALLEVHINNNFSFNPSDILNSMEEQRIDPNKTTCLLLIKKYCIDGNLGGASEILEYMKDKGFSANEEVFNHLIEGHLKNNDFAGAEEMIKVMNASNLKPTEDTYVLFACAYAVCGDKNQMMQYLSNESTKELYMSDKNYLKVIEALSVSGNDQHIDDVLSLINSQNNQQELINLAVELINKGHIEAAYKLSIRSVSQNFNTGTNIFIKQLIKMEAPASQIIHYCNDISNKGINNLILLNAAKSAIEFGKIECAFSLFKERSIQGYPVRVSYFFSLFEHLKEIKAIDDIWLVLKKMCELGIPADFTLYLHNIFPAIGVLAPSDVIQNMKKCGQETQTAYDALFVYYLNLGELDHAFNLIQTVPVRISITLDFNDFLNKYQKFSSTHWKNISGKYFKILKYILENVEEWGQQHNSEILRGKYLAHLILTKPSLYKALCENETINLSQSVLNFSENILNRRNPSSLQFLNKMKVKHLENQSDMTVQKENSHLDYLENQRLPCKAFLQERISHHMRSKNIDRVFDLLSLYEKHCFSYTPFMLTHLITLFKNVSDLQKSKEIFAKLKNDFPSFKLDVGRIFDYAGLLTKYTEFDEALKVLKDNLTEPYFIDSSEFTLRCIKHFFADITNTKNVEFVRSVQNLIMPLSKVVGSKNVFLEPLINVHLFRGDLSSAVEEYRSILMKHHIPAGLKNILKKCINIGDKSTLQKIIDFTISYSSKSVALLNLSVAFIETFHLDKAVTVIQSLGEEADSVVIEEICDTMYRNNKHTDLEQFIHATKVLAHVDKEKLDGYLLRICVAQNDCKKALEIFSKIKQKVHEPSSTTVNILVDLLKKNNEPIPDFLSSSDTSNADSYAFGPELSNATENFVQHLKEGNAVLVLNELNVLKKGYIRSLSSRHFTDLVDLCLENNCLKDLSLNVHAMSYIIDNFKEVVKPILIKHSAAGQVEKLITIANCFPDFSLKKVGFNSFFAEACISADKPEYLLSELEEKFNKKSKLFSITAFDELLKFPELEDRVLNLAKKYLESNFDLPIAVAWSHYFILENYKKADELFQELSKVNSFPIDNLINSKILRNIRENENVSLAQNYISFINQVNLRPLVKTTAYATLLELLVLKGKYDDAVNLVLESEKLQLLLHKHYRSTLITLKGALETQKKHVPFSIPREDFVPNMNSYSY